ncbi:MAG TPA: aminopeptidase [Treponema sp.]|nr:aminopeptidase [Treponema sp.]
MSNIPLDKAAATVVTEVLAITPDDQFLILTNPTGDVYEISMALYRAALAIGAEATVIIQPVKTQLDFANKAALAAFGCEPSVSASVSANKMGKDRLAMESPWEGESGRKIDHVFHYLRDEKKTLRAIWTPGITVDMFIRTAPIDYTLLQKRCADLCEAMTGAESIHVSAPGGTDIVVPVSGREPMSDDGKFTTGGSGGNIPAGEVFISPLPGKSEGVIVFDGSISLTTGDMLVKEPVHVFFEKGYITDIRGGKEAELLEASIRSGEDKAREFQKEGKLTEEEGISYARNARGLGELGIGLNPSAEIRGNMLEDEKAFHTCHFAIGSNYDNDADAMIHLDCLVKNPTITVRYPDGRETIIEKDGKLLERA